MRLLKIKVVHVVTISLLLASCARRGEPLPAETIATEAPSDTSIAILTYTPPPPEPTTTPINTPASARETPAESEPFMGIQVNRMDQEIQAERFKESGAEWSRADYIRWEDVEPENVDVSQFHWEMVDEAALLAAVEAGQRTIAIILFTPSWAQKYAGIACGPIAQESFGDFAEFMGAVVSRYSVPPYNVKYWEIGNEPDIDRTLVDSHSQYGCWGEAGDEYYGGGYYGEMLKVVYPAVKAADPESRLIIGGMVMDCDPENPPETAPNSGEYKDCTASRFLEGILEAGAGDYFDGVSFHAYDYYYGEPGLYGNAGWNSSSDTTGPVLIAKTRYLRSLLNTYQFPEKELLNTELAVLCGRDGKEDYCLGEAFANTKASYVSQANAAALAEGIKVNLWYSLTGWRGSGLIDQNAKPVPAFRSYQYAASQLNGAVYLGEVTDVPGVKGYRFKNGDKTIWLIWSLDGSSHTISLPDLPSDVYDMYGEQLAEGITGIEVEASAMPVYIEWSQ